MSDVEDKTLEIIKSEFPKDPEQRFFFVAFGQVKASNSKAKMRQVWGDKYVDSWVDCRDVKNISQWGCDIWHDRFVFDHTVWDNFSDLEQRDQQFMIALTDQKTIGEFFEVEKKDTPFITKSDHDKEVEELKAKVEELELQVKKRKWFGRTREWMKNRL